MGFGPQLVDLNKDGKADMISGSWPGEIYFFERKPNGSFSASTILKHVDGRKINVGSASAVAVGDWTGDGREDLIIGNIKGELYVVKNSGKGTFEKPERLSADGKPILVGGDAGPFIADWDGDGAKDLLVGSGMGDVQFFRNKGTTEQPDLENGEVLIEKAAGFGAAPAERSAMRTKPAVADWNGDGRLDLLVGDFSNGGNPPKPHGYVWVYLRKADKAVSQAEK